MEYYCLDHKDMRATAPAISVLWERGKHQPTCPKCCSLMAWVPVAPDDDTEDTQNAVREGR